LYRAKVVADELAPPVPEERTGMLPGSTGGEVVDDDRVRVIRVVP